jgi:hypothetical protein
MVGLIEDAAAAEAAMNYGAPLLEEIRPAQSVDPWAGRELSVNACAAAPPPWIFSGRKALCTLTAAHDGAHYDMDRDRMWPRASSYCATESCVDEVAGPERRTVCGAVYPGRREGVPAATCDREIGHDADPESNHFNQADGFSWPTARKIAESLTRGGVLNLDELREAWGLPVAVKASGVEL